MGDETPDIASRGADQLGECLAVTPGGEVGEGVRLLGQGGGHDSILGSIPAGNQIGRFCDYSDMKWMNPRCRRVRESISARIDGEQTKLDESRLDKHIAGCLACRTWEGDAVAATRRLRVRRATPVADLSPAFMIEAGRRSSTVIVAALVLVGLVQLALGVAQLLIDGFGHGSHGPIAVFWAEHLFNEGGSWNIALGIAFLWAARDTTRAVALSIPLSVFGVLIVGISVVSLLEGSVPIMRVVTHVPAVTGAALLALAARRVGGRPPLRGAGIPVVEGHNSPAARGQADAGPTHEAEAL